MTFCEFLLVLEILKNWNWELIYKYCLFLDEVTAKGDSNEGTDANIDALRATEYEQLARLCLDEKQ